MRFTIISALVALQLVSASVLPRSDSVEYSALEDVEPFNITFAQAHLDNFEGPVLESVTGSTAELASRASGNVYVCINAGFQPACSVVHWTNDVCGKSCKG